MDKSWLAFCQGYALMDEAERAAAWESLRPEQREYFQQVYREYRKTVEGAVEVPLNREPVQPLRPRHSLDPKKPRGPFRLSPTLVVIGCMTMAGLILLGVLESQNEEPAPVVARSQREEPVRMPRSVPSAPSRVSPSSSVNALIRGDLGDWYRADSRKRTSASIQMMRNVASQRGRNYSTERGKVLLIQEAAWLQEFIDETAQDESLHYMTVAETGAAGLVFMGN